jgi:hypothetical protein
MFDGGDDMFAWFIGTAVLAVWWVFRDPSFDYRSLVVGALVPLADLVVVAVGGDVLVLHSVVTAVVVLVAVMLATRGRRQLRKVALGVPIGMMVHLVTTGAWQRTSVFWWPLAGGGRDDVTHPVVERGWWGVGLEVVGVAACVWLYRRANLSDPDRRTAFWRSGRLDVSSGVVH